MCKCAPKPGGKDRKIWKRIQGLDSLAETRSTMPHRLDSGRAFAARLAGKMVTSPYNQGPLHRTSGRLARLLNRALPACIFGLAVLAAPRVNARGLPVEEGILNYGKISDRLYRGAQPDIEGIQSLKRLGVKLIVNLRMPGEASKQEATLAQAAGIQYTNFPMNGFGRPGEDQMRQILALFESASGPTFVHCLHGCDRTGTVVAWLPYPA
jgi:protein tyrosine phosphatase (PTP) superfamily phosphohydrolase (DUF442 family)